ncbi:MAG: AmmeMemoRadiSam system radical SAM enzyme [Candidatus Krumholzibacteriota bacterium]|nr:AmmeMemoRadiSam system radical SAM enzyme [Candidatus Krumholzibacteriota bacterium]
MKDTRINNPRISSYANRSITRRSFLSGGASLAVAGIVPGYLYATDEGPREACFYEKLGNGKVSCTLCPHNCRISPGKKGICRARKNIGGTLFSIVYSRPCSLHIDPIEKKPFFHFLPGTRALSISTAGCNMRCKFCQNWQISQSDPEDISLDAVSPETIVSKAVGLGAESIAYTYGEPVVFYEYMSDIATLARKRGVRSVVVTNGYYSSPAIQSLCEKVDAIKIDLKSFSDAYYRDICGGSLKPVLDALVAVKGSGVWLEIVYLMVPGLNDDPSMLKNMSRWLVDNLGADVPLHYSRFQPAYRLSNIPPTTAESLERAWSISRDAGIRFVYIGNLPGHAAENTYCPDCGEKIISRKGYTVGKIDIVNGKCLYCGNTVPGSWGEAID